MGVVSYIADRLSNVMSGMGTSADKRTYAHYTMTPVIPQQAEVAYRTSWLFRKIIDIPPLDMTRAWRAWQAEKDDIEALELAERRLALREKCKRALILARLWGGSAIVIGIASEDPGQELRPDSVTKDGLTWLHVFSRHQLGIGPMITDPASPWFGMPEYFTISTTAQQSQLRIHPSRVIAFVGQPVPEGSMMLAGDWFWGDPLMQSIDQAVKNADLAQDGFAALIDEAKVDIIKIPDMMANVGTQEYETRLLARLGAAATGKSVWRALMIDSAEEWEQRQVTWTGMPDIITSYLQIVAGAADIPVTRLLGQSPKGLASTGEGEERDYHAMIMARQNEILAPALDRIDEVLIRSALGDRSSDIYYTFNPLSQPSPKDAAEIEYKRATTIKTYVDTGLLPDDAAAAIATNGIIESGYFPGSEAAFEEAKLDPPFEQEPDPNELLTAEEIAAQGAKPVSPAKIAANDAWMTTDWAPRSLYVSRAVINRDDIVAWAKSQGFTDIADDLHVTITYSETPVDWMAMGESWRGKLEIEPGGPRLVDALGPNGKYKALLFTAYELVSRNAEMREKGASYSWAEYQPHISIQVGGDIDLTKVKPYTGKIVLGPEIFEEIRSEDA